MKLRPGAFDSCNSQISMILQRSYNLFVHYKESASVQSCRLGVFVMVASLQSLFSCSMAGI